MKVVVYSHDADTRARVRMAIGKRPAPDVPVAEVIEVATHPALIRLLDAGGADVMVLDGEAARPRTRSSTARRYCSSSAGPTTAGWPPGPVRTRW